MPTSNRLVFPHSSTSESVTSRTAVYGPVRTVVWQGSAGDRRPYADLTGYTEVNTFRTDGATAQSLPLTEFRHSVKKWQIPVAPYDRPAFTIVPAKRIPPGGRRCRKWRTDLSNREVEPAKGATEMWPGAVPIHDQRQTHYHWDENSVRSE